MDDETERTLGGEGVAQAGLEGDEQGGFVQSSGGCTGALLGRGEVQ